MIRRAAPFLLAFCVPAALGAPASVNVAPAPDWARPLAPALEVSSEDVDVSDGLHYLLMDLQESLLGPEPASYNHRAWRVLGETGVLSGSTLRIEFDPSYQRLVLHEVVIHREGLRLPRLDAAKVRLIQREERLDAQIYDGTVTALFFVEGVRDRDVVEYSYTLWGDNPTFQGRWATGFGVRWSTPVVEDHYRLLCPLGRTLRHRGFGTELQPHVERLASHEVLTWRQRNVEAMIVEPDVPSWHETWPWIQLSEWASWTEVADWGRGLFEPAEPLPASLRELAARWREEGAAPAELARRALRLVQDEVRYLGLEFGPNAYQPTEPATVYERRFGDCKDKSVLLVQLLRALGLDASPALVDTRTGRLLPERLPTPLAFDHAVVRLTLEGEAHWLDATRIHERGPVERLTVPDWRWALVLEEEAGGLTRVEPRDFAFTRIEELVESPDYASPARFTVTTRYEGSDADGVRDHLSGTSREELSNSYRDYYAAVWAGVEVARPLEVEDDELENVVVTREHYRIRGFWRDSGAGREAEVWSLVLDDRLDAPSTVVRERPIAVAHPVKVEQRTELRLPAPWVLEVDDQRIRDAAFRFDYRAESFADGRVVLSHRYETSADEVEPSRAAAYRDNVERARGTLGLTLSSDSSRPGASPRDVEWPLVALVAVSFAAAGLLAGLFRRRGGAAPEGEPPPSLGGLLIPASLLVLAGPVLGLARAWSQAGHFRRATWRALTSPGSGDGLGEAQVLLGLLGAALLFGLGLLLVLDWFTRRRRAPGLALALLAVVLLLQVLEAGLRVAASGEVADALLALGRLLIEALVLGLLGLYLVLSDRVRETFVR